MLLSVCFSFFCQVIIFIFILGGLIGIVQVSLITCTYTCIHYLDSYPRIYLYMCTCTIYITIPSLPPSLPLPPPPPALRRRAGTGQTALSLHQHTEKVLACGFCTTPTFDHMTSAPPHPPRASIVCMIVCLLIFFDDYACVLIAGNSLRSVSSFF